METGVVHMKWSIGWSVVGVLILAWVWSVVEWVWWKPKRLERALREQGLQGTPYRLLFGDLKEMAHLTREARSKPMSLSHQITPRVVTFLQQTINTHGKISFIWFGTIPRVIITDPDLMKEILSSKFGHVEKPSSNPLGKLLVTGLVSYDGERWAKHRRIINPAFHQEKLKRMLPAFATCCVELINRWEKLVGSEGPFELDIWPELQSFTGDVISRTAFGSSYEEGRRIFQLQTEQAELFIHAIRNVYVPGYRFVPTKMNRRRQEIYREVRSLLRAMIEEREKSIRKGETSNDDLLGLLMESNSRHFQDHGNSKNMQMSIEDVIEECKLFYFAGQETTSVMLTWTMVVLSMHPDWQARARDEVLRVFGKNKPDMDGLNRLKIVTMILYEVLRLYPPAVHLVRSTYKTIKLGEIILPPGVELVLPVLFIHHDLEFWGKDANEFKPERFSEGVSKASKYQGAFFPFGWGPRICIGQSFAMIEAKIGLAMILQHFTFELSPSYMHAPCTVLTLQPQHGAPIILHRQ